MYQYGDDTRRVSPLAGLDDVFVVQPAQHSMNFHPSMSLLIIKGITIHITPHMMDPPVSRSIITWHVVCRQLQVSATITACVHKAHLVQAFAFNVGAALVVATPPHSMLVS